MPFEFKLPDLGEGVQEGEIVRWLVREGDTVRPDQPVVEVMTDKVTAELPAPVGGRVVRLGGRPGEVLRVGEVLLVIEPEEETAAPSEAAPAPAEREAEPPPPPVAETEAAAPPRALPAVRRLARELGVDLSRVTGTGPGGRILESDVRAAAARAKPAAEGVRRVPLQGVRRAIAEHLLAAHRNTAPFTYVEEADLSSLVRLREQAQPLAERAGVRLTYLPFFIAATCLALREHPNLNACVDETTGDLLVHEAVHMGIAVHTEEGLLVPVIRDAHLRGLLDLAREIDRLSRAAREGRLSREEVTGGTFTITSLGAFGGLMATPMLNTPQVAILGVHRIAPRPVVREGHVTIRDVGHLSLTLDHRYIDGFVGASFVQTLIKYLQEPAFMLFRLAEERGPSR